MCENWICALLVLFQDIEKEVRKEVDDAIAKAKVRSIYAEERSLLSRVFNSAIYLWFSSLISHRKEGNERSDKALKLMKILHNLFPIYLRIAFIAIDSHHFLGKRNMILKWETTCLFDTEWMNHTHENL